MRSVLVTGATGFIGRAFCARMVEEGWRVRGTVRELRDVARLPPGVEPAVVGQIGPETAWEALLQGVDCVVHLAARVHVMREEARDPLAEFRRVNVAGTERLARAAADCGVKRFVFVSSIGVNGNHTADRPFTEDDEPNPQTPYAVSKCEAEAAIRRTCAETAMEWVVLRPPLAYGPGNPGNILSLFHVVARRVPLPLASVRNSRSFIGLANLVDALYRCLTTEKAANNVYLVSDDEDVSTPELIRKIGAALGIPAKVFPFPVSMLRMLGILTGNRANVDRLLGSLTIDIAKIRHDLDWVPPCAMERGLRETADWYKQNHRGW